MENKKNQNTAPTFAQQLFASTVSRPSTFSTLSASQKREAVNALRSWGDTQTAERIRGMMSEDER